MSVPGVTTAAQGKNTSDSASGAPSGAAPVASASAKRSGAAAPATPAAVATAPAAAAAAALAPAKPRVNADGLTKSQAKNKKRALKRLAVAPSKAAEVGGERSAGALAPAVVAAQSSHVAAVQPAAQPVAHVVPPPSASVGAELWF